MTSPRFNARKAEAVAEMTIFDQLPAAIRAAIVQHGTSVRASFIRDALLRGVSVEKIIETINKRSLS